MLYPDTSRVWVVLPLVMFRSYANWTVQVPGVAIIDLIICICIHPYGTYIFNFACCMERGSRPINQRGRIVNFPWVVGLWPPKASVCVGLGYRYEQDRNGFDAKATVNAAVG